MLSSEFFAKAVASRWSIKELSLSILEYTVQRKPVLYSVYFEAFKIQRKTPAMHYVLQLSAQASVCNITKKG